MTIWIVLYHHRHGVDAWPFVSAERPDLDIIESVLDDFEEEQEEFLESLGPYLMTGEDASMNGLLEDIISSSDANCAESLANAIDAAKEGVR